MFNKRILEVTDDFINHLIASSGVKKYFIYFLSTWEQLLLSLTRSVWVKNSITEIVKEVRNQIFITSRFKSSLNKFKDS